MSGQYAIYLRKSRTDVEAEARGEGETLARHRQTLLEFAQKHSLHIVKIYEEIVSGDSIASRPEMQYLLQDVELKKYTGVLVMEIERLARGDTIDQGIVAQAFKNSETKIITPIKTYDPNNEFDEEYFEFSLFMSRREYKTIKRRMQAGRLASVKEGNYLGQREPYGYRKVTPEPKVHTLEVVPEHAEVVKMIFDMYLKGYGGRAIARELNKMGIAPQKNQLWGAPSVKKILSNPIYIGKVRWQTKSSGDTLYEGKHESIIPEDVFEKVQIKRAHNAAVQLQQDQSLKNYYNKILYCSNCGHQMRRRSINGKEHMLCTYPQCSGKIVSSKIENINEAVLSSMRYRIKELEELRSKKTVKKETSIKPDKQKLLVAESEKIKKQLDKLHDLLEQDVYDINTFLTRSKTLNEKLENINNQIKLLESHTEPAKRSAEEAITKLNYVIKHFEQATAEEKNMLLKSVIRKINYKKTVRMCYRKDISDLFLDIDFL